MNEENKCYVSSPRFLGFLFLPPSLSSSLVLLPYSTPFRYTPELPSPILLGAARDASIH